MDCFSKIAFFAVLVVLTVAQTNDTASTNSTTDQTKPLSCLKSDGLMANWQDETCSSYFVCDNFVLRVVNCEEGKAFSIVEHACVERSIVQCEEQNNAVRLNVRAAAILRQTSDPSYVMPDLENEDPNNPISEDARVAAMLHSLRNPQSSRTKRAALKALGVPTAADVVESMNITFPDSICEKIHSQTAIIEALMNAILLTESGCRDLSCGIPLLRLHCPIDIEDEEEEVQKVNASASVKFANIIQLDTNGTNASDNVNHSSNSSVLDTTNITTIRSNSTASDDSSASNIFGLFEASDNNGNKNLETTEPTHPQGQTKGNIN